MLSFINRCLRYKDIETAPSTCLTINLYFASVHGYYHFYIAKTQPETLYIMDVAGRHPVKLLEYFFLV